MPCSTLATLFICVFATSATARPGVQLKIRMGDWCPVASRGAAHENSRCAVAEHRAVPSLSGAF